MTENETIEYVEKMDVFEKSKFYMNYYINMLSLKHNFEVIDLERSFLKSTPRENKNLSPYHGMGEPDKEFRGIAFYYLWKNLKIKSFEDFCSKSNIQVNDTVCEDWEEKGFASKSWMTIDAESIYHYVRIDFTSSNCLNL
jgi:hypothetical protein